MEQATFKLEWCPQPRALSYLDREGIKERKDEINELKNELTELENELTEVESFELDLEPAPGEEVLYDCVAPSLDEELRNLRVESNTRIDELEAEIKELKRGKT